MNSTYLLLGSNMGNSPEQLQKAKNFVEQKVGNIAKSSGLYQTAAWGYTNQPDFLNQVILVQTAFGAAETLHLILNIEQDMGRIRTVKNAPRIIDIDILFFNHEVISSDILKVPHPEIPNRRFVLIPLNELSPNFIHPVFYKSISRLLSECVDTLDVKKVLTA